MNNSRIDDAILAVARPDWLKVARVITDVARVEGEGMAARDDRFQAIAERIEVLVHEGRLVAQGNLRKPRYSEVRLPGPLVTERVTACMRNLRMLSGIKQIWARENNKGPDDLLPGSSRVHTHTKRGWPRVLRASAKAARSFEPARGVADFGAND